MILGIDIGSSAVKAALLRADPAPVEFFEWKNRGNPADAFRNVIRKVFAGHGGGLTLRIGITGAGRDIVKPPPEIFLANEVVSLALAAARYYPEARSIIEIGAQASRWVLLGQSTDIFAEPEILDFALNDVCAAGSGAFLEQQAARLKLDIEEFGALAGSTGKGAPIAGRCSVFAKTDMIHLQQKGTPLEEIAYGLCQALARNFVATVLKGREALAPVLLAGGGFRNSGLVNAFREILELAEGRSALAAPPQMLGALGAAAGAARAAVELPFEDPATLVDLLKPQSVLGRSRSVALGPLEIRHADEPSPRPDEFIEATLGVDIGSVSTNLVLLDAAGEVKAGVYLPTKGRPIEVLKEGYRRLRERCPAGFELLGIGTTGSGRHLAGSLLQADVVHNEITSQLRSAVHYVPDVDTIFEIGGQDSKFISARNGRILDFAMNKICAAGTGSFLEEQAEILGIRIEDEFSELAASSAAPAELGSRCTVFMETELADSLGRGVQVPDIAAGLAFSIARNYLEKVVAGRPIGRTVVFQGGVASNPSVVRAFAMELGRDIMVHPHNRISGAIGAALLAKERVGIAGKTSPDAAGIDGRLGKPYTVASFTCGHCSNRCQVNRIAFDDKVVFFGDTCERYTAGEGLKPAPILGGVSAGRDASGQSAGASQTLPDLFQERGRILETFIRNPDNPSHRIGLPRASVLYEFLPFWAGLFNNLGAEVVVSPDSNHEILNKGLRKLPTETCLPIKIAFGHVEWFADKAVDWVFFPSITDRHKDPAQSVLLCPLSENFPHMVKAATEAKILAPSVALNGSPEEFRKSMAEVARLLGKSDAELREAYTVALSAQRDFETALQQRGRQILSQREILSNGNGSVWAILGRPYTLHDPFLNLNLGRHLSKLGILGVPIDFLPLDGASEADWPGMPPWRYNRQVIEASLWALGTAKIRPVVLTNFGCGLDAFAMRHVEKILAGEPHLVLEFDEHRGEAGLITRLEAFLDEVGEADDGRPARHAVIRPCWRPPTKYESYRTRKFILPYFADHAHAFSGALKGVGVEARVLPLPDSDTVALGEQHSTGKECHAFSVIAGDFVKFARSPRQGGEVFYFPGSKDTCVLAQYDTALNYLAEDLGITDFEALAPTADFLPQVLTMKGMKLLWQGLVAIDLLIRASCAVRPYEVSKGATGRAHEENLKDIEACLAAGDIGPALERSAERLKSIEARRERRPVVGIAGDIYTRVNPVGNHDLFLKLEELGCEVRPSSFFVEEVDFDLGRGIRKQLIGLQYGTSSIMALMYLRKELEKTRIRRRLEKAGRIGRDPTFNDIVRFTSPYLGLENNQFLLLNVAKMVNFAKKGAAGVVNAICFNCMLGAVSAAISAKIREDFDHIPLPTFIYTGSELSAEKTRLEAFVYQVHQFARRKERN